MQDGISIIICCYNSGWIIRRTLDALKKQHKRPEVRWEVILVDNCCTDDTVAAVRTEMEGSNVNFRIVEEKKSGLAYARRKGINEVRYSYVIYCDDDNLLCPTYVQTVYDMLSSNPRLGAVGGKGIAEFQVEPAQIVKENLENYAVGSQMYHKDWLFGAGVGLRTSLVKEIYENQHCYLVGRKGNQLLSGDDSELVMSIFNRGFKVHPTDNIYYTHVLKDSRLTEDYFKRMRKGLELPLPMFDAMRCAMYNKPFNDYLVNYFYQYKHVLWSLWNCTNSDASDIRKQSISYITNTHHWGLYRLWRVYKEWRNIRILGKWDVVNTATM